MVVIVNDDGVKHYPVTCCKCGNQFYITKSILQEMGLLDYGTAKCSKCNEVLSMTFIPGENRMESNLFKKKTN